MNADSTFEIVTGPSGQFDVTVGKISGTCAFSFGFDLDIPCLPLGMTQATGSPTIGIIDGSLPSVRFDITALSGCIFEFDLSIGIPEPGITCGDITLGIGTVDVGGPGFFSMGISAGTCEWEFDVAISFPYWSLAIGSIDIGGPGFFSFDITKPNTFEWNINIDISFPNFCDDLSAGRFLTHYRDNSICVIEHDCRSEFDGFVEMEFAGAHWDFQKYGKMFEVRHTRWVLSQGFDCGHLQDPPKLYAVTTPVTAWTLCPDDQVNFFLQEFTYGGDGVGMEDSPLFTGKFAYGSNCTLHLSMRVVLPCMVDIVGGGIVDVTEISYCNFRISAGLPPFLSGVTTCSALIDECDFPFFSCGDLQEGELIDINNCVIAHDCLNFVDGDLTMYGADFEVRRSENYLIFNYDSPGLYRLDYDCGHLQDFSGIGELDTQYVIEIYNCDELAEDCNFVSAGAIYGDFLITVDVETPSGGGSPGVHIDHECAGNTPFLGDPDVGGSGYLMQFVRDVRITLGSQLVVCFGELGLGFYCGHAETFTVWDLGCTQYQI
jgi:hypothetical protein